MMYKKMLEGLNVDICAEDVSVIKNSARHDSGHVLHGSIKPYFTLPFAASLIFEL